MTSTTQYTNVIIQRINDAILQPLVFLLFALAAMYFLFGLMKFIQNQDNEEAKSEGKKHMVWGIIGIALMVSVRVILGIIQATVSSIH